MKMMAGKSKVYYINRYDFHKPQNVKYFSGYEQIVKYSKSFRRIKGNFILKRVLVFIIKNKNIPKDYIKHNLSKEMKALFIAIFTGNPIFYLYADKDAFLVPLVKKKFGFKRIKIYGTLHWPIENSTEYSFYKNNLCEQFNGIITLSNSLTKLPNRNITVIPHGIDLEFWHNNNSSATNDYYLLLGQSNRNHNEQVNFIKTIYNIDNGSKFIILTNNNSIYSQYEKLPNVSIIKKRVSDIELKQLYSNAKAVVLIQHNCLASNVVLESIAMNVPLLTNRIGDIEEYLGMEYPLFTDIEENIHRFIHDKDYSREIELYLERIKLNFSWKEIAEKTIKFIGV